VKQGCNVAGVAAREFPTLPGNSTAAARLFLHREEAILSRTDRPTVRGPKIEEPGDRRKIKQPPEPRKQEKKLEEGLEETFPASDPPAVTREPSRDAEEHPNAKGHKTH
jgi:hypothetical protein